MSQPWSGSYHTIFRRSCLWELLLLALSLLHPSFQARYSEDSARRTLLAAESTN